MKVSDLIAVYKCDPLKVVPSLMQTDHSLLPIDDNNGIVKLTILTCFTSFSSTHSLRQ